MKKAEADSGRRGGVTTGTAEKMKALEREVRELSQGAKSHISPSGSKELPVPAEQQRALDYVSFFRE